MSTIDEILDSARNTSDTLTYMANNASGAGNAHAANTFLGGVIKPPQPFNKRKKVATNDGLLKTEIETLKTQLATESEKYEALEAKMKEAYGIIEAFREDFEKTVSEVTDSLTEKVCLTQSMVYDVISMRGSEE